jgi:YHS domain-containing protein
MEGLLTFLLFAGVFYLVMRVACGAHAVHGHRGRGEGDHVGHGGHGGHGEHGGRRKAAGAVDPVCGMEVAPGQGYTRTHTGHEYRLCSQACADKFEANPDRYASVQGGAR